MNNMKPKKEDYGWHTQSGFDNEPSGWQIEGGEEAYAEALEKWQLVQKKQHVPFSNGTEYTTKGRQALSAKNLYKKIRSIERRPRKVVLIMLIINLKSNYLGSAYCNENFREQMRHLLRGTKSWSGDVLFFFEKTCSPLTASPSHVRSYYGVSKNEGLKQNE